MALGGNYNNNQNGPINPTYYSRLRIKNFVDNKYLTFNYWKGTLKIAINEASQNAAERPNELAAIYMSPNKARILAEGVNRVIASKEDKIYGVDTGSGSIKGFITIGRDKGDPFLFIAKVNANGNYETSQRFNFNNTSNFLFDVKDLATIKFQKENLENIDLETFRDLLVDYSRSANGALAASVHDINFYEANRMNNLIKSIANKAGINTNYSSNSNRGSNTFFDNSNTEYNEPTNHSSSNNSRSNRYENIDDLEDALE